MKRIYELSQEEVLQAIVDYVENHGHVDVGSQPRVVVHMICDEVSATVEINDTGEEKQA